MHLSYSFALLMAALPLASYALEKTATNDYQNEVNATTLKIEAYKGITQALLDEVNKIKACNSQKKFYDAASAEPGGCVSGSGLSDIDLSGIRMETKQFSGVLKKTVEGKDYYVAGGTGADREALQYCVEKGYSSYMSYVPVDINCDGGAMAHAVYNRASTGDWEKLICTKSPSGARMSNLVCMRLVNTNTATPAE